MRILPSGWGIVEGTCFYGGDAVGKLYGGDAASPECFHTDMCDALGDTADFRCSVIMNACVPMAVSADGSNTSSTPEHAKALSGIRVIWVCERSTRFSRSQ